MQVFRRCLIAGVLTTLFWLPAAFAAPDTSKCAPGWKEEGLQVCNRAIASGSFKGKELSNLYRNRGMIWSDKRDYDRAIADLDQAVRLDPNNHVIYNNRGNVWIRKKEYERAISDFGESIRLSPSTAIHHAARGFVRNANGEFDRAISDFDQAIRLDPAKAEYLDGRGRVWLAKKDFDRALRDFEDAIRLKPDIVDSYVNRALTWKERANIGRAIESLDDYVRRYPDKYQGYFERGKMLADMDEPDRAIADFTQVIKIRSDLPGAYSQRGGIWLDKGEFERAMSDYDDAIRVNNSWSDAYNNRGRIWFERGQFDRAIAEYDLAIKHDELDAFAYNHRAEAFREKGRFDKALSDIETAIRLEPKDDSIHVVKGNILRDQGGLEAALAEYDRAIGEKADYPLVYLRRGGVLEKLGQPDRAKADYRMAVSFPVKDFFGRKYHDAAQARLAALSPQTPSLGATAASSPVATQTVPAAAAPVLSPEPLGRRVALIIGNSVYKNAPILPNPGRDAAEVAATLRAVGFEAVTIQTDASRETMIDALRSFAQLADNADWALVYYSGHGLEMGGVNYLLPVDARLSTDRDVGYEGIALDQIMNAVDGAKKLRLVVLDACRDNPFLNQMRRTMSVASRSVGRGLARIEPDAGTLVVFAAKHGETALDGDGGNSPFTTAFVKEARRPGLEVRRLFDNVRDQVMAATNRRQQPFSYGSLPGNQDFFFVAGK